MNESTLTQLNALVEKALAPVWAATWHKQKMHTEMLAHVCAVFEEELERLGDEPAALERTTQRFGNPAELTQQLQESITAFGYVAWFLDSAWLLRGDAIVINHDRFYNVLLFLLGLYIVGGLGLLAWLIGLPPEARPDMQWPDWSLPFFVVLNGFYLTAMSVTLMVRIAWPGAGKHLTKILNLLFLLGPPLGTALGIYGLWKVDKNPDLGVSS